MSSGKDVRILGQISSAPPVLTGNGFAHIQINANGALLVSTSPAPSSPTSAYDSAALATGDVIKAAAGNLIRIFGFNNSGSTRYFQLFDAAAVPADGTVPDWLPIQVPTLQPFAMDLGAGLGFSLGISWASSSTLATKTITGAADMWVSAQYL